MTADVHVLDYYQRAAVRHADGTPIFQTSEDRANEQEIATILEQWWHCNIRSFGKLSPVDWYAERHGRLVALLELKVRTHAHTSYATVFLNVRKWLALTMAAIGLDRPAFYVVGFTDGIYWVPLTKIDPSRHIIGGCRRIVKSVNDVEPVIEIPVLHMHALEK